MEELEIKNKDLDETIMQNKLQIAKQQWQDVIKNT